MNAQQTMEDAQLMQHVQIQLEVLVVNVILDIQEMVSIVMVSLLLFFFFFWTDSNNENKKHLFLFI